MQRFLLQKRIRMVEVVLKLASLLSQFANQAIVAYAFRYLGP